VSDTRSEADACPEFTFYRFLWVWLDQLFTPYVHEAYRIVREEQGLQPVGFTCLPKSPEVPTHLATLGHLGLFNLCLQQYNNWAEWVFDDTIE